MQSRIFLIGFMGSGKTTLGRRLARRISYNFVDMDHLIEETADMGIPDIFREHGEETFRKWERDILLELCSREKVVISTGGGAPCHGDMMDLMSSAGATIYIEMTGEALRHRLIHARAERPLIKGKSEEELLEYIQNMLEKRSPFYKRARYHIDGSDVHMDCLIDLMENRLSE